MAAFALAALGCDTDGESTSTRSTTTTEHRPPAFELHVVSPRGTIVTNDDPHKTTLHGFTDVPAVVYATVTWNNETLTDDDAATKPIPGERVRESFDIPITLRRGTNTLVVTAKAPGHQDAGGFPVQIQVRTPSSSNTETKEETERKREAERKRELDRKAELDRKREADRDERKRPGDGRGAPRGPSSDCDPAYRGRCLDPTGPDYDCSGGGGDGPRFVSGPFRIVGEDHYRLDGNGNGIACE
ncbi:MAG TPA: hypothetical protein VF712_04205 [Thermoleophilaceae bacterium]